MDDIKWAALAAAGLLAVAPQAQATVSATASLTNFQYQLFDLDPSDGIAASVSFAGSASAFASATDSAVAGSNGNSQSASGAIGAGLSVSALQGISTAQAQTFAGNPTTAGAAPGSFASASTSGIGNSAYGSSSPLNSSGFTLSPRTLLVFSASVSSISVTSSVLGESAYASVTVGLYDSGGPSSQQSLGQAYAGIGSDGYTYSNVPGSVSASFTNLSGLPVTGTAYVQAYASVSTTAVPEPRTYALMLAGLLSVRLLTGRHRFGRRD